MSRLMVAVALLGAMGITVPAIADEQPQQTQQPQAEIRDGRWLRAGIREYQRFSDKAANQTLAEASRAVSTVAYIKGVLDEIWSTMFKAQMQEMIINTAKKSADQKAKLDAKMVEGMQGSTAFLRRSGKRITSTQGSRSISTCI